MSAHDELLGYVVGAVRGHLDLTTAEAESIAHSVLENNPYRSAK